MSDPPPEAPTQTEAAAPSLPPAPPVVPVEAAPEDPPQEPGTAVQPTEAPAPAAVPANEPHEHTSVWARIKEHKIAEWTLAYVAFAFALLHGVTLLSDALEWPHVIRRSVTLVLIIGLPVAPTLAWYHGVRALKRVSGSELIIIALLLAVGGSLLWLVPRPTTEGARTETASLHTTAIAKPNGTTQLFAPPAHSIAVLPFTDMSEKKDQEYFADGLSEELINALTLIDELQVAARTSSFSFKGEAADVETIGRKLHVGAVLEGSVRRSANTVRVAVQLINASNGFHIWSRTYDRDLKDVLAVQSDIAIAVAQQLQVKLLGDEAGKIEVGGTRDPRAYDAYLRATQLYAKADSEELYRVALAAFDQAIALDANFAAAYGGRAFSLLGIAQRTFDLDIRGDVLKKARVAAERAVALAPDSGEAHLAVALVCERTLVFGCAASEFDRALALAPGSAQVQSYFARFASLLGHRDVSQTAARRAVRLDPQNYYSHIRLAGVLYDARLFNEAIAAAHEAEAINPDLRTSESIIFLGYLALGRTDLARQTCESPATVIADDSRHWCLALAYHALRMPAEAQAELLKLRALGWGEARAVSYAGSYAQWGDTRAALDWLATAERTHASALEGLKVNWLLDPIRNEPEFKALEQRLNFPP